MTDAPSDLALLARRHGVATSYEGSDRIVVQVDPAIVVAVLAQLGVDASTPGAVDAALAASEVTDDVLPPTIVVRAGAGRHLERPGRLVLEDGTDLGVVADVPDTLPLGYHRLTTDTGASTLLVVPDRLPEVPSTWGWMVQLYALHSAASWGIGDFGDLGELLGRAAEEQGAGVALVSPVQGIAPVHPIQRSPYSPASRRFANPLHLRVTDVEPWRRADAATRERVLALAPPLGDLIDHDAVWDAKLAALEELWPFVPPADRRVDPQDADHARYSALAERHGGDWRAWPSALHDPAGPAVAAELAGLAERVAFHAWLQRECRAQLDRARAAMHAAGATVGVVHDLPVGVAAGGPDTWTAQAAFALDVRVGCPADAFNELGQDWGLPPWKPSALAAAGYAPFRDVVRSVLRHGDGIRVDHVAGLWRLWWIPPGEPAHRGTYVHYDAEAMLGVLLLEAVRADAIVVGEDLGTVEQAVTDAMHERGVLSSAVLWFERDWDVAGQPHRRPADWDPEAMASITTHDLPTATGWLEAEHVRLRASLDLLDASEEESFDRAVADRAALMDLVAAEDLDPGDPVLALHALIARAASRLVLSAPTDVVGERRQPNLPGTVDEYPSWRIPLPLGIEEFFADPRVAELVAPLRAARPPGARP